MALLVIMGVLIYLLAEVKFATINGSTWRTAWTQIQQSDADVIFVQETRLGKQRGDAVRSLLQRNGWEGSFSHAWDTSKGAQARGAAMLWKQWVQSAGGGVELHPGKCLGQPRWFKEVGLILAVSIYGFTGRD